MASRFKTPESVLRLVLASVFLLIIVSSAAFFFFGDSEEATNRAKGSGQGTYQWRAGHESGDFSEYTFTHESNRCGSVAVVSDPTGSGRGRVALGEITCPSPDGGSHRLYPTVDLPRCYLGPFRSQFLVWFDVPEAPKQGWISIATYSTVKGWKDLFGLMLAYRDGAWWMDLSHVPVFGKGDYTREAKIPFPTATWVRVGVTVAEDGLIRVFQDGTLVMTAEKRWDQGMPSLCEAHWGLYAHGAVGKALVLNDDLSINLYMVPYKGK